MPSFETWLLGYLVVHQSERVDLEQVSVHVVVGESGRCCRAAFAPGAPDVGEQLEPERRVELHAADGRQKDFLAACWYPLSTPGMRDDVLLVDEAEGVGGWKRS